MAHVDKMQHVCSQKSQSTSADVKLFRFVSLGHHAPVARQLVAIHVRQLADPPDAGWQLASEQIEHAILFKLAHNDRRRNVIELAAIGGPEKLDGQPAPTL